MAFDPTKLITEDGNVDVRYMREIAVTRASRDFGGPNPPDSWVRPHLLNLEQNIHAERMRWRKARGLPDDTAYTMVDISTWTDTFRRVA